VAKNERELNRHSTFYLKHRQERENKLTAGSFTKDEHDNLWIILERLDEARIGLSMLKR
jgi:hypothetical protein